MGILIHVAYGKAGSTFLQHWFRQHPELFVGDGWDLSKSTYKNLGNNLTPKHFVISSEGLGSWVPHEVIRCEFDLKFDIKKYQHKICNILKKFFTESKILIVTRNYDEIIRSNYSQYIKSGGDLGWEPYLNKYLHLLIKEYDFNYLINLYSSVFGKDNVIVIPYELLRDDYEKCFSFLDEKLDLNYYRIPNEKFNPSLSKGELYCYPIISKFVALLCDILPFYRYTRLYQKHISFISKGKYKLLVKFMKLFTYQKTDMELDCPQDYLSTFKQNGTILNNYKFYERFKDKYFLVD